MTSFSKTYYIRAKDGTFIGAVSQLKLWVFALLALTLLIGGVYFTFKARSMVQGHEMPVPAQNATVNTTELCTKTKEGWTDCTDIKTRLTIYRLTNGGKDPIKWYSYEEATQNKKVVTVTAYNSVPEQTDSTPDIAANGENIMRLYEQGDFTCAASLPFGTKLSIPGFGVCTVRDRLAPKYSDRVDIHMGKDIPAAWAWGIRKKVEVVVL